MIYQFNFQPCIFIIWNFLILFSFQCIYQLWKTKKMPSIILERKCKCWKKFNICSCKLKNRRILILQRNKKESLTSYTGVGLSNVPCLRKLKAMLFGGQNSFQLQVSACPNARSDIHGIIYIRKGFQGHKKLANLEQASYLEEWRFYSLFGQPVPLFGSTFTVKTFFLILNQNSCFPRYIHCLSSFCWALLRSLSLS